MTAQGARERKGGPEDRGGIRGPSTRTRQPARQHQARWLSAASSLRMTLIKICVNPQDLRLRREIRVIREIRGYFFAAAAGAESVP